MEQQHALSALVDVVIIPAAIYGAMVCMVALAVWVLWKVGRGDW